MLEAKKINKAFKLAAMMVVLVSLFAQSVLNLGLALNYQLNNKYITSAFCENRDKPCMHCNGKCYLRKQLQKENSENSKIPARTFSSNESIMLDLPVTCLFSFLPAVQFNAVGATNTSGYIFNPVSDILRPPVLA